MNTHGIQDAPQGRQALSDEARWRLALMGHADGPAQLPHAGSLDAIKPSLPKEKLDCSRCEGRLELGLFFDGTDNNRDHDLPLRHHSNVARLYAAYPTDFDEGYGRVYIPGVGTPFNEVSDAEGSLGGSFGKGGEARVDGRHVKGASCAA